MPEDEYAVDCRVYAPEKSNPFQNVTDLLFDHYILCHFFGWWFKMIIIRDIKLCWFLSVLFEFLEITFRHQLPNFWECWWDSAILDVLIANGCGIYLGHLTCRFARMKEYHWGIGMDGRGENDRFTPLSKHVA